MYSTVRRLIELVRRLGEIEVVVAGDRVQLGSFVEFLLNLRAWLFGSQRDDNQCKGRSNEAWNHFVDEVAKPGAPDDRDDGTGDHSCDCTGSIEALLVEREQYQRTER